MAVIKEKEAVVEKIEGEGVENESLPVLFLYNEGYRLNIPNSYSQVFTKEMLIKNKLTTTKFTVPIKVLWVGKNLAINVKDKEQNSTIELDLKDLSNFSEIGYLGEIEKAEEFLGERLRLSINTYERVIIHSLASSEEGLYYGQYVPYPAPEHNLSEQEQEEALSLIEEIKEKFVTLKSLSPEKVGELEFPVRLKSQTIEEYASIFSSDATSILTVYNIVDQQELFATENIVWRLQGILTKLNVLIDGSSRKNSC